VSPPHPNGAIFVEIYTNKKVSVAGTVVCIYPTSDTCNVLFGYRFAKKVMSTERQFRLVCIKGVDMFLYITSDGDHFET
jgi:hypothetical protein